MDSCTCALARDVIITLVGSQCQLDQVLAGNATIPVADSIAKCEEL